MNLFEGPSQFVTDLTVQKRVRFGGRYGVIARADIFNVFNTVNWSFGDLDINSTTGRDYRQHRRRAADAVLDQVRILISTSTCCGRAVDGGVRFSHHGGLTVVGVVAEELTTFREVRRAAGNEAPPLWLGQERCPMSALPITRRTGLVPLLLLVLALEGASPHAATLPPGFSQVLVTTGLSSPTAMQFAPGRAAVCRSNRAATFA